MNRYTLIAGVNGTGKSSLCGVLEGQKILFGHIIDADYIAKQNGFDVVQAGKQAIFEINQCLKKIFPLRRKLHWQENVWKKQFSKPANRGIRSSFFMWV